MYYYTLLLYIIYYFSFFYILAQLSHYSLCKRVGILRALVIEIHVLNEKHGIFISFKL